MGIVIKQSIRTMAITIIGAIMGVAINLLSIKYFFATDFGFTQNLIKIALLISYISSFGFGTTLVVYGQKYHKQNAQRSSFITLSILVPAISTLIITLLYALLKFPIVNSYHSGDETLMRKFYILFPILTLFTSTMLWLEGYLQSIYKTAIASFAREILNRIVYLVLIILFGFQLLNFDQFIWSYTILFSIPILYLVYFIYKYGGLKLNWSLAGLSSAEKRKIIGFSLNQTVVTLIVVLIIQIDSILLGPLSIQGLESIAIYGTAMFAISMMRNPIRAMSMAALPSLTQSYYAIKLKELRTNFNKSVSSIQILVVFCSFGLIICMPDIQNLLNVWKPGYELVGALIMVMLVGNGFDLLGGLSYEVIALSKYYRYNTLFALIALLLIVVLVYCWIGNYGLLGVAWASSVGMLVYALLKAIFIYKKFKIVAYSSLTLKIFGVGVFAALLAYFIPIDYSPILNLLVKGSLFTLMFGIIIFALRVSPEVNQIIKKFLPFFNKQS